MTCLSAEEIAALFDGRLPRLRAAQGREHLASCPRCASEIQRLSRALRDVAGGTAPPPSAELLAQATRLGPAPARPVASEAPAHAETKGVRPSAPSERK